ncbi:MAG: ribosome recycling factor [Clostridiales bacterium]|nr:ribosome recycling factor [Clostridiales bacterium]
MDSKDYLKVSEEKMGKTIDVFRHELASMRAGRANPQILDRITVDYYGSPTPLNQLGNISAPEPRVLLISVWDQSVVSEISKAIMKSDLGMNPIVDGKAIRLIIPELTEERRKQLVKLVHRSGEDAKVAIRSIRRDAIEQLKKLQKEGAVTEDDMRRDEKEVQKITDNHVKIIDDLIRAKEKEIMAV